MRARDAGMDVVYEGIRLTPAQIARSAIDEGVHVIGLSILSGSHRELIPDVIAALDGADIPVVVGGIIPDADVPELKGRGRRRRLHAQGLRARPDHARDRRAGRGRAGPPPRRRGAELGARGCARGDRRAGAGRAATCSRRGPARDEAAALVSAAGDGAGHIVGVTGPPGSASRRCCPRCCASGGAAGARSPCSRSTRPRSARGGALLGDRARIEHDPADRDVFIRSMAAGERLGGLAPATRAAAQALANAFDVVVIETVGVGQSETDVAEAADTVVVVVQPGSGDALQFLKAGIMEVPDVLVVTKADLGARRTRAEEDLRVALRRARRPNHAGARGLLAAAHRRASTRSPTRSPPTARARHTATAPACAASARSPTSSTSTASAACARSAAAAPRAAGSSDQDPALDEPALLRRLEHRASISTT